MSRLTESFTFTDAPALPALLEVVRQRSGLGMKQDIRRVSAQLPDLPADWHPNGDDTAAIPLAANGGRGYQLLAIEGMQGELVERDPWFAGWCGVMVNCSDIAAMGGRPTAVVNATWSSAEPGVVEEVIRGMRAAALHLGVHIVGGHTNVRAAHANLAVAIVGHANRLLSSFAARPGQILVAAIDQRGSFRGNSLNWNAATSAPAERLQGDLALLADIADAGLAVAAKDISQAGLLGTCTMLLESARCGAVIDLASIPKPASVCWQDWLCAFPSYGYVLTTTADQLAELLACFHRRDIAAAAIGRLTEGGQLMVDFNQQHDIFYDLTQQPLTGF
ncbi:sll0787 family AIR synthase-like protein [Candidatus Thalassolituus haligoni]|uniref:sll0787 family AIR synthase-like protein n=1 Tax=Candidatus Thalassolituus haligoni TaxID=3100113 RepID=UPI0035189AA7